MNNEIKIALVGAAGRMGLEIVRAAGETDGAVIGAAVEHASCPVLGQDVGELAGLTPIGVPVVTDLKDAASSCDVILDITLPKATNGIIDTAVATRTPLVSGVTGVTADHDARFGVAGNEIPVLHTKNFSVGVNVLSALVKRAVSILGDDYDIEVVEMHHRKKADAPSGTALLLAEAAAEAAGRTSEVFKFGREGNTGARTTEEIGIHGVRGGGVFGDHTVILAGTNERVELSHRAETRALFAGGAVRAALYVAVQKPGRYTMPDVLGLNNL